MENLSPAAVEERCGVIRESLGRKESWKVIAWRIGMRGSSAHVWASRNMDLSQIPRASLQPWSDEQLETLISLHRAGLKLREIVPHVGHPMGSVGVRVASLIAQGVLQHRSTRSRWKS